ncbi:MAG: DNA polymerase III subunit gamma/tau [Deltaproteobacteria bacterium]|nr:DNA polymerase III subunit gamma/tau [Deltaproteobacteria bacterium]
MSYLVLARKFRPQVFEDVLGQPHVTQTLQNALKSGRVAQAYLFSGPRGVGKTSVARILAKSLNCQEGPGPIPCNRCSSCLAVTQGSNLDVFEIDGASNRGIDDIRELRENIKYLPAQGRFKIYIVDEVHMLTGEAFNALLKTLEEPPAHAVFIMATTELNKVPLTIYSRCQSFHFRRISPDVIVSHLAYLLQGEQVPHREGALRLIARQAEGSLRDSLSLLDQVLSFSPPEISETLIQDILGLVDRRVLRDLAGAVIAGDLKKIIELTGEIYEFGYDLKYFFRDLVDFFRGLLLVKMGCEQGPLLNLSAEEIAEWQEAAAAVALDFLQDGLHFLIQAEGDLRRSSQPRLALELVLLRLAQLREVIPIDVLLEKMEQLDRQGLSPQNNGTERLPEQRPVAAPALKEAAPDYSVPLPKSAPEDPPASAVPEAVVAGFDPPPAAGDSALEPEALLAFIRREALPLASILDNGCLGVVDENTLEWDFGKKPFYQGLMESNGNIRRLEKLCQDYLKRKVRITVVSRVPADASSRKSSAAQISQKKRKLIKETLETPQVREVLQLFEGEVVDVKVPD